MRFFVISACRAANQYIDQCLNTVGHQTHRDFLHCITVDDIIGCPEAFETYRIAERRALLDQRVIPAGWVDRHYALHNQLDAINRFCPDDAIVVKVDGDDYLADDGVLASLDAQYSADPDLEILWTNYIDTDAKTGWKLRNGHCRALKPGEDPITCPWVSSHLQTFRKSCLMKAPPRLFLDPKTGRHWHCSEDQAVFRAMFCHSRNYAFQNRLSLVYRRGAGSEQRKVQRDTAGRIVNQLVGYREELICSRPA